MNHTASPHHIRLMAHHLKPRNKLEHEQKEANISQKGTDCECNVPIEEVRVSGLSEGKSGVDDRHFVRAVGSGRGRRRARRGPLGEGVGADEEKRWMVMQDISEDGWGGVGFAQILASIESDCGL